ncbi:hypothetical protein BIW11_05963 [Tropilaelaps mercedesae]|uniref:Uncharacterized protein n=1 Tax=Tropilaelaps mercedesae TaxID=418985 RepID=A0A1V9Y062_9ACAR|nr:hypothetical protein BIW11_05963 [Tropilaelaps mercedesae]
MIGLVVVLLASAALTGAANGKPAHNHPIDLANLEPDPPAALLGPSGPSPSFDDFPRSSFPNPPLHPEALTPLGATPSGLEQTTGPPRLHPPPGEPSLTRPRGDVLVPLGPTGPDTPNHANPLPASGPNERLPSGSLRHPADDFPPLEPGEHRGRNFSSRQFQRGPGDRGASPELLSTRANSPQRSPSWLAQRVLPAGGHNSSLAANTPPYTHLILAIHWTGGVCVSGYINKRPVSVSVCIFTRLSHILLMAAPHDLLARYWHWS